MTPISLLATALALFAPEFAAPASMASFDATALTTPTAIKVKSEDGQRRIEGVAQVLAEQLSQRDRTVLGRKVLSPRRVTIATGDFPGGADTLVVVSVDLRMKRPEMPQKYISGVFTMTPSGTLGAVVVPLKMRTQHFALQSSGDVDADGMTDAVVVATDDEGARAHLFSWNEGASIDNVLSPAAS